MSQNLKLIAPEELEKASKLAQQILKQLDDILLGRSWLHKMVLTGILSRGHILLEGAPGVGKTALIKVLGELLSLEFKRVQFTPDLMPGDILGAHILQQDQSGNREMIFQPGPVFTNILLADEINRASPKTQSALLEAMQERSVTLMGNTRELPDPFVVLASQNPIELEGTYPLPEAQLDRFLFKLEVQGADAATLKSIIYNRRHGQPPSPDKAVTKEELNQLFACMDQIFLPGPVAEYIACLVCATTPSADGGVPEVNEFVQYGASPRAAIAVAEAARGLAMFDCRPSVGFEDVNGVFVAALNHRVLLNYKAKFAGVRSQDILENVLQLIKPGNSQNIVGVTVETGGN